MTPALRASLEELVRELCSNAQGLPGAAREDWRRWADSFLGGDCSAGSADRAASEVGPEVAHWGWADPTALLILATETATMAVAHAARGEDGPAESGATMARELLQTWEDEKRRHDGRRSAR